MDLSSNSDEESRSSDEDFLDDSEFEGENSSDHDDIETVVFESGPESETEILNVLNPDVGLSSEEASQNQHSAEHENLPIAGIPLNNDNVEEVAELPTAAGVTSPLVTLPNSRNLQDVHVRVGSLSPPNAASTPTSMSRKRYRESPPPNDESKMDEDSMMCPICFESWTTSGAHRLVSLRCGHLFGLACIEKWIKQPKAKCPQCNHLARRTDIRKIYARSLKVLDTSERDRAIRELEKEQEKRRHAEVEAASMRLKLNLAKQECERVKMELQEQKDTVQNLRRTQKNKGITSCTQEDSSQLKLNSHKSLFVLDRTLELSKEGGCRLLAISNFLPLIIASQPSINPLYPGFGFKKIFTMDYRQTEFVPVHQKMIKDMAFHSHDSLVLSTALDRTIKITNVMSNSIVQTYSLSVDAWSCTWNSDDPSSFFAGLQNGQVLQFDTRMTSSHVCQLPSTEKRHPVVALQYVQKNPSSIFNASGPVSLQFQGCTFFEKVQNDFTMHPIPVEGNFTSLSLEPKTGHMLISCRPSTFHQNVTHLLCELTFSNVSHDPTRIEKLCSSNVIQVLKGGLYQSQLTRSHLTLKPGNDSSMLVCSGDESSKTVMIWDTSRDKCLTQMSVDSPALDLCSFKSDSSLSLAALSDKQLKIYKWNICN